MWYVRALLLLLACPLIGQSDSLQVTKNFHFQDGIYLDHFSFRANQPDHTWDEVQSNLFTNPQTYLTQIEFIRVDGTELPLDSVWMVCLGGIPYLRLPAGSIQKDLATFAGLQVRGKICYLNYPKLETRKVEMSAYNPVTGRPFRTGLVEREEWVKVEQVLHFESGVVRDFTVNNLLGWIQDDAQLVRTIQDLSPAEAKEKLFKCLLIYDDRNLVFVPAPQKNDE